MTAPARAKARPERGRSRLRHSRLDKAYLIGDGLSLATLIVGAVIAIALLVKKRTACWLPPVMIAVQFVLLMTSLDLANSVIPGNS